MTLIELLEIAQEKIKETLDADRSGRMLELLDQAKAEVLRLEAANEK